MKKGPGPFLPSWLVRSVTWPLHQAKTGRHVSRHLRALQESERWAPERLRAQQAQAVARVLRHAMAHAPYYRERFAAAGLVEIPDDVWSIWDRVPVLSKAEARAAGQALLATDRQRACTLVQTSGSTGTPMRWQVDRAAEDVHHAVKWRARGWWGVRVGDRQAWLWGRDEQAGPAKAWRDLLVDNKRLFGLLELSDETVEAYYARLRAWRPQWLYGYASGLVRLAQLCARRGHDLSTLRLRAVVSTAEVLTAAHRDLLRQAFGCPIVNEYGCAEAQVIAAECPSGSMHLSADALLVEFLRDGHPVAPGELGDVVVTDFSNEAMPVIRYRTGDLGRPRAGACACGRTLPLMELTVGRELEMVRLPDGRVVHPEIFTPPHAGPLFAALERFRVIQDTPTQLHVQVVTSPERLALVRREFEALIRRELGASVQVLVERVERIDPEASGKLRYFISRLPVPPS